MSYNSYDIDNLLGLCDELYAYVVTYDRINGGEEIYRKFMAQINKFDDKYGFMNQAYAPRAVINWFIRQPFWIASDVKTIRTILAQVKEENFTPELALIDPLNLWNFVHVRISTVSKQKVADGHYADAVESAMKAINARVKALSIRHRNVEKDGKDLMNYAFSPNNPLLQFNSLATDTDKNIQTGYMQMFAGAMQALRNPTAHDNLYIAKEEALKQIVFASMLMDKIDEALIYTGLSEY